MAESKTKAEHKRAERKGPRFTIRTPAAYFKGDRCGVRIFEGVGRTDDAGAADRCALEGYEVTDEETGKVRNPIDPASAKAE